MPDDSGKFTCNLCGAECASPAEGLGRETASCTGCGSSVRLRALTALLSRELFGVQMALPEFPVLKSLRGIGMTDPPALAGPLAEKFDYTNTFYHQAPRLDLTQPDERDFGRYDFIVSSEVMEHVPAPVERAFSNLCRLLKPDGLLLFTTPYGLGDPTIEHFPELHEYTLATLAGSAVLVNRRRDGSMEVFEDLVFHGGDGSTLEMRVFRQGSLHRILRDAGFAGVDFATESWPEWGVEHAHCWSLPIVARKGHLSVKVPELACAFLSASRRAARITREFHALHGDYERFVAFHNQAAAETTRELEKRTQWAQEGWDSAANLERELDETRSALNRLRGAFWTRAGRKLRLLRYIK